MTLVQTTTFAIISSVKKKTKTDSTLGLSLGSKAEPERNKWLSVNGQPRTQQRSGTQRQQRHAFSPFCLFAFFAFSARSSPGGRTTRRHLGSSNLELWVLSSPLDWALGLFWVSVSSVSFRDDETPRHSQTQRKTKTARPRRGGWNYTLVQDMAVTLPHKQFQKW